jgi:uroporphyrinogen-III decarboxylase
VGPLFGYVGPELCIPPLQSPRDFEEWVVGPDAEINDLIRAAGGLSLVHCHGRMGPVLEGFVRMGASALHPIEPPPMGDVTLAEAKARVGRELCIVGNVQEHDIQRMPTAQFRAMVAQTVTEGMAEGGFILSPTATPFGWPEMSRLARENWIAMLEVGLAVGSY